MSEERSTSPRFKKIWKHKNILVPASLGLICLTVPILMIYIDPIFIVAKYKLRITNGSILHEMMMKEIEATRLEVYVFNVSNADQFLSGKDQKLRVEDVGPFVYQEYRTQEEIEFDPEKGVVRFIPRFRIEFVPEESVGLPNETILLAPNIPYLSMSSYFRSYPSMLQSMYSMWVKQLRPKPIRSLDVHQLLWGYQDNIVDMCKTLVPGVMYYDSIATFDVLYDQKADYKVEMDITLQKKFQVRSVMKKLRENPWNSSDLIESKLEFQDTYEGAAFPPQMTPQMPLNIYRLGICKKLGWEYVGQKRMKLGSDAFLYHLSNSTFKDSQLCDSKGTCPQGVLDLSSCFYGVPIAVTKTHLLDVDPEFQKRVDGLWPDREKYRSYILIEPKMGLTVDTSMSLQLNMLLGDLRFMPDLAQFSDMLLPIMHGKLTLPELPSATKNSLILLYLTGPQILLGFEIVSWLFAIVLIAYSAALVRHDWARRKMVPKDCDRKLKSKVSAELPLLS